MDYVLKIVAAFVVDSKDIMNLLQMQPLLTRACTLQATITYIKPSWIKRLTITNIQDYNNVRGWIIIKKK